jgi:hypothetical protein
MSQITGLKLGTPYADALTASIKLTDALDQVDDWKKAAISRAAIYTYDGDDTIQGTSQSQGNGRFYGLYQGLVNSGHGHDTVTIQASPGADGSYPFITTAVGICDAALDGGRGNDTIKISATGISSGGGYGYGQIRSVVHGGEGHDVITIARCRFRLWVGMASALQAPRMGRKIP